MCLVPEANLVGTREILFTKRLAFLNTGLEQFYFLHTICSHSFLIRSHSFTKIQVKAGDVCTDNNGAGYLCIAVKVTKYFSTFSNLHKFIRGHERVA